MAINDSYAFEKYFNKQKVGDGTEIVDFLDDNILDHEWDTISRVGRISSYHEDRLDFLASELLEENMFWWVLLISNGELDPFDGFSQGDFVIARKKSEIFDAFEEYK